MARISPAMQKYLDASDFYLRSLEESGATAKTINHYASIIEAFRQFWEDRLTQTHIVQGDPGVSDIIAWKGEMAHKGLTLNTIRQYISALDRLFEFTSDPELGEYRFYESNPVAKRLIPNIKKESARPYDMILTGEEVAMLWDSTPAKIERTSHFWARNYAVVVLLLSTGLRNTELLTLRPRDISWEYEEIAVEHGKGNKFRMVDFPLIAQTAVKMYLESGLRPAHLTDDDYLFGTQNGKVRSGKAPFDPNSWECGSRQWLSGIVERHVQAVTGVSGVKSHDLRHIAARLDLNNGMTIEELQSKLGHSNMKTTQIYSGRILARRKRMADISAYTERDTQAKINIEKMSKPPEPKKRNRSKKQLAEVRA